MRLPMRLPSLRVLRYVAYAWLAYALIGNLLLNTAAGLGLVNRKPEKFRLAWSHALTLWPGQAWLWNVNAQGRNRRLVWQARAARASGRIALLPLVAKELRLPWVDAHDVHVQLDLVNQDLLPPAPQPDGWTVRLDAIASESLRSVRFGPAQLEGVGEGVFGMRKQLRGGPLEILPSTLRMRRVRARAGTVPLLSDGDIEAAFTLPAHRRERAPGLARLGLADARLVVNGALQALRVALDDRGHWHVGIAKADGVVMRGTAADDAIGRLDLDLAIERGSLVRGGHARLDVPVHTTNGAGAKASGDGHFELRVGEHIDVALALPPPPGDGGHLQATLAISDRALPFACRDPAAAELELGPSCTFDADTSRQLRRVSGDIAMRWHFESLAWFGPLLARTSWLRLDGAGEIDADLRIERGELAPGSSLIVPALNVTADVLDNRIDGQARAEARIEKTGRTSAASVALTIERFRMRPLDAPEEVHVRGRDLRLDLRAPGGQLTALRESLSARLRFADAEVPDLRVYNRYLPRGGLRLLDGRGVLGGDLQLDAAGEVGHGQLNVRATAARLAIGDVELDGDLALDAQLKRADLARRVFELDGSRVALTNVRIADAERADTAGWWARGRLERGRVEWNRPLRIDARFDANAKNVGLLLGLFGRHRDYPRWTLRLIDAGQARLGGRVRMDGDALILDPMQAANDRFDVQARLHVADRQPSGNLLLAWGRLKLGLELVAGARHWHVRKAAEWFAGRGPGARSAH